MNLPFIDLCKTIWSVVFTLQWKSTRVPACVEYAFKSSINDGGVGSPELVASPALVYPSEGARSPGLTALGCFHGAACCYSLDI